MKLHLVVVTLSMALALTAAKPVDLDWKAGILLATAQTQQELGSMTHAQASARAIGTGNMVMAQGQGSSMSRRLYATWRGYSIRGDGMNFMVMYRIRRKQIPNVTVNAPVRYALQKGKFYLLDEDGKYYEMAMLEKALPKPQLLKE